MLKSVVVSGLLILSCTVAAYSQSIIQAEDAALFGAYVRQDHAGYNGSGYVSPVTKTGAYLEFVFRRTSAAADTIRVRYANGGSARNFAVTNNGASVGSFSFASTGGWSTWSERVIVVSLQAGVNRLRFTTTTNTTTYPSVDHITVNGQASVTMFGLALTKSGNGSVSASPVATYHDAGTSVELTATPSGGSFFSRWMGGNDSPASPYNLLMNGHKNVVGVFLDTAGTGGFTYEPSPRGFASLNALGNNGTTGGMGGDEVTVTTGDELWSLMLLREDAGHVRNLSPLTVYVAGILSPGPVIGSSEMLNIKDAYDISIIGIGDDATITGVGLNINRSVNIIVRNITFASCPDDGIAIEADDDEAKGHHIWIDHCTFSEVPPAGYPSSGPSDGGLDVTHTAAYVTISWNHFAGWDKNSLMGHSNGNTADVAMKVTYHHNYFDSTRQRNPRVRFGKAHVYNNYYRKNVLYGVSSNMEADVVVEGCYFVDVPIPTESGRDGGPEGDIIQSNNIFVNCGIPETRGAAFDPSTFYSYTLDSASTIPQKVTAYAGRGVHDFSYSGSAASYTLNVSATNGTVGKVPDQPTYTHGTNVQLTATPSGGFHFVNWTGDVAPSQAANNPLTVTMDGNKALTANFTNQLHTLSVSATNGTVAKVPDLALYPQGSSVQLTPTPSGGFFFVHWTGDVPSGDEADNPLTIVMNANTSLTAVFSDQTFTLTTNSVNGSISRNPNQATYNNGATVALTAVPDAGYHFVNWSGDAGGSGNPVNVLMDGNKNVTANFAINQYTLGITAVNGSVGRNPDQALYDHGTNVGLTAGPNSGYIFSGWSGDASGTSNPVNVAMTSNKSVTANFTSTGSVIQSSGGGGGLWGNAGSWAGGTVPTSTHHVVIVAGDSIFSGSTVTCNNLTVQAGGTLAVTAAVTVNGLFTLEDHSFYYHGAPGTFTLPGATRFIDDASTVVYNLPTGATSISAGTFGNLVIARGANTNAAGVLTINGDLTLNLTSGSSGLRGTSGSTSRTNQVNGNVYIHGGTLSCIDNGTGSAAGVWNIAGDVLVSGNNNARLSPFSSGGASTVTGVYNIGGNLTIDGGRLQYASNNSTTSLGIINLAGDLVVTSGSSITDNSSTGPFVLNFSGSGTQTVTLGMNFSMGTSISDTVKSGSSVVFSNGGFTWGSTGAASGQFVVNGSLELKDSSAITGPGSFVVNPGGTLKIGSADGLASSGTTGNIRVSGTRNFSAEATYEYAGAVPQATGSGLPSPVENVTVNNAAGVTLSAPLQVNGILHVTSGNFDLNGNTITLASTASLSETPGNTVTGATGSITTTRSLDAPDAATDIGGLGVRIGSAANLGSTVITRGHAVQAGVGSGSVARYVDVLPANNTGLNASFVFRYEDAELNGNPEVTLAMFKSTDAGASWTQQGGAVNTSANTVSVAGLNGFSRWTAGVGAGVAAVTVAPGSIDFGSVPVSTAAHDTVTVSSVGGATLVVDSVRVYGPAFSFSAPPVDSVATGNNFLIDVMFSPALPGVQNGHLVVHSNAPTSPDTIGLTGTGSGTSSLNIPIAEGWNMISNPVATDADSVRQLFPSSSFNYAFAFNPGSGYEAQGRMVNGAGFWGKFPAAIVAGVTGQAILMDTIVVDAGWNMIGSISMTVDTADIQSIPAGIRSSLFYSYDNGYIASSLIEPGCAYWVKMSAPGALILQSVAARAFTTEPGGRERK